MDREIKIPRGDGTGSTQKIKQGWVDFCSEILGILHGSQETFSKGSFTFVSNFVFNEIPSDQRNANCSGTTMLTLESVFGSFGATKRFEIGLGRGLNLLDFPPPFAYVEIEDRLSDKVLKLLICEKSPHIESTLIKGSRPGPPPPNKTPIRRTHTPSKQTPYTRPVVLKNAGLPGRFSNF